MAAHIYVWCKTNACSQIASISDDTAYRDSLAKRSSDLELLRDVAKAQKHVHLDRATPVVTTAAQVSSRSTAFDEARWDEGRFDGPPQVVVTTNSGEIRYVEQIVASALAVLEAEMTRFKI